MAAEPDTLPSNLTIGAVCRMLGEEFDDISISKIRFLEDQKLIAPRRTQGGYRLFSLDDVERLRAILRMQRDEFLPLAVIRDMLTQGVSRPTGTRRRRARALAQADRQLTLEDLVGETDADLRFIQELEEYALGDRDLGGAILRLERDLGDRLIEHPLERGPQHLLFERNSSSSVFLWRFRGDQAKVHAHRAPLLGRIDLSEAILVHPLHPHHARPPTRKMVWVGHHSPDGMR